MALTARQRKFIDAYLVSGNATSAAVAAGYSAKTARAIGSENLTKPDIASELAKRQAKATEKADLTLEAHLASLNELRNAAAGEKQYSAAVSAEVSRGRAAGFYVDKKQLSGEVVVRVVRDE